MRQRPSGQLDESSGFAVARARGTAPHLGALVLLCFVSLERLIIIYY
jgi:hypothetical protein